jgi:hypothetical protein
MARRIYSTFAPMALAAVNAVSLPVALRRRSISIHMERAADSSDIRRFDQISAKADLDIVRQLASAWANQATLAPDPAMPKELGWRGADVWRVLISIADAYGEDWPERARSAARIMARNYNDEDIAVTLLRHIREIFEVHLVDRIYSALLVGALLDLEDGPWSEWRGVKDDQPPRKLTQATVASVLKAFHIRPRSIWPAGRTADSKSRRGYYKADFEPAWRSYCPRGDTPPQAKVFKLLRDD